MKKFDFSGVVAQIHAFERQLEVFSFPDTADDVKGALLELLAAQNDKDANFQLWPRGADEFNPYDSIPECKEHWRQACNRADAAVSELTRIARAMDKENNK